MNDPLGLVDPDGRYPWIANLKSWVSALTGSNPWRFPSSDEGKQISYPNKESLDVVRIQNTLCSFVGKWSDKNDKNYSPKLASYMENKSIPVGIFSDSDELDFVGFENKGNVGISEIATKNTYKFEGVFAYELTHRMYPQAGDIGAYGVEYSLGKISGQQVLANITGLINNKKMSLNSYEKALFEKSGKEGFLNYLKKKGEELRGKK